MLWCFLLQDPGPSISIDSYMSASDLFGRFYTEVWEIITVETIRYAPKQRQQCVHVSRRACHMFLFLKSKMKRFIGISKLMGICRIDYWTTIYPY